MVTNVMVTNMVTNMVTKLTTNNGVTMVTMGLLWLYLYLNHKPAFITGVSPEGRCSCSHIQHGLVSAK